jgi:hypothetical protein
MAVTAPKETWTDSRLNDLSKKVDAGHEKMDEGFDKVDATFREVRGEMKAGFDKLDAKMDAGFAKLDAKMDAGFAKFDKKFDRLIWWLLGSAVSVILALLSLGGTLIATHGL